MFQKNDTHSYENSIKKALKQIEEGLANIDTNEEWLKLMSFQARFHSYSFNNIMMIYLQNPEATYVAGYHQWKKFDRYVRKGETSLKIFAPLMCKREQINDDFSDDMYEIRGFKLVSVFDLFQTDGSDEKLPILITGLKTNSNDLQKVYFALTERFIIDIQEKTGMRAKGSYDLVKKVITIKAGLSSQQKIKTLIHEYAHHLHHTKYFNEESRDIGEIIAESSAFIVCSHLGINCKDYSIPYVKTWCNDISQLKLAGDTIQKISCNIIKLISEKPLVTATNADQEAS